MILGRFQSQSHARREPWLPLARLTGTQPLSAQPQRLAEGQLALQLAGLVLIARHDERARRQQVHVHVRRFLQFRRKPGPHLRRAQPQLQQTSARLAPNSTSATGASIPAATYDVPRPTTSRSRSVTDSPFARARHAMESPMIPPPTIVTSGDLASSDMRLMLTGNKRGPARRPAAGCATL